MITEAITSQGKAAITSDQWHVVHSHFDSGTTTRPFARSIVSEHATRNDCEKAARRLRKKLAEDSVSATAAMDEVMVRPPHFKSLKAVRTRVRAE